jgi:hypothetical protein
MVLAALLTGLAWWLSHQRTPRTHEAMHAPSSEPAPWLAWASSPIAPRDATTISDAAITSSDAGPSTEARDRLGALLVAQICARRDECLCGAYPSPYAEGHETATTCEADVMRDFLRWWSERVTTPVVLVDEAELLEQVDLSVGCTGTRAHVDAFVRADAVDGEPCGDELTCRDGASCDEGLCMGRAALGAACTDLDDHEWDVRVRYCADDLRCVRGRCDERLPEGARCDPEGDECSEGLSCDHHRCERVLEEGDACEPDDHCGSRLECSDGRCAYPDGRRRCERPTLTRYVGPHRDDDESAPRECIPFGTPCLYESDCGFGHCEGAGRWICDSTGPHGSLPWRPSPSLRSPICDPGAACWSYEAPCECPLGSTCRGSTGSAGGQCVRDAARGEDCRVAACAAGLSCDFQVPGGGRCVGYLCMQTRFFP